MNPHELWNSKEKRDTRAKQLQRAGFKVRRSSIRNQELHPMYVEDLKSSLSEADKGFGNTIYKTYFAVLYQVEWQ